MPYGLLADLVVVIHFAFIVFAVSGGLLALRWRFIPWLHLPAATWGGLIEFFGWVCPLTPLERALRAAADAQTYRGGFIEHYFIPIVYPPGLTREVEIALGVFVLIVNLTIYRLVWERRREER